MQVSKWGNSLAIRLPASVVEALELREGDDIEVTVAGERAFEMKKKPGTEAFLARLRPIPKMLCKPTQTCFWTGKLTPAMRAMMYLLRCVSCAVNTQL